jgi:hypothetical protein
MSLIKTLQKRTIPQASDSELVDEKIYPLCPSQKAETAVPEYKQIDWGAAEQNQGQPERWHTFESP